MNQRLAVEVATPAREVSRPAAASLGLWDAVSIIIGIVVGTMIYETPPFIFGMVSGPWLGLGLWAVAGVLSLIGALCYAELASTYPRSGGDYVYLTRAYGPWLGFLFGWAQLAVILTGSIGMLAYAFADYSVKLGNLEPSSGFWFAFLAVALLSLMNMAGVVLGKTTQNVLAVAKVVGLAGVVLAGLCWAEAPSAPPAPQTDSFAAIASAMVLVFLTYGGWNDAAYVAAEVRNGKRNIPLALILGTLSVTVIYLLVNLAYVRGLGFAGVQKSDGVAADVLSKPLGEMGKKAMCVLVMVSAAGGINGLIFTGSRVYSTLGADHRIFAWLGRWHPRLGTPLWSLLAQAVICLVMITAVGATWGQSALNSLVTGVGLAPVDWAGRKGFDLLLRCTAPVFWFFFLLTGLSLFILRVKDRGIERPFKVPLVLPLIFCATCAYMLYSAIQYADKLGLVGGALLVLGLPLYWLSRARSGVPAPVAVAPAAPPPS